MRCTAMVANISLDDEDWNTILLGLADANDGVRKDTAIPEEDKQGIIGTNERIMNTIATQLGWG